MNGVGRRITRLLGLLALLLTAGCSTVQAPYFEILFVDKETGRGIPLVEIETTHQVRYVSDSAGRIAINPETLGSERLFFHVKSHGYEAREDDLGFRGIKVSLSPGEERVVPLRRVNIAERLYRVTGEGIYNHSILLGEDTPLPYDGQPGGGVFGQDSVVNAIYNKQLYWFWGDTKRGDRALGNFEVSGAVSPLPDSSGNDPSTGINLDYFVGEDGFSRPMCPVEGSGMVWINGLLVVEDAGREHMLCGYSRMESLGVRLENGIAKWNDKNQVFEKLVELPLNVPLMPHGHPVKVTEAGVTWLYFGKAIPNVRVRAKLDEILDPENYQVYTCLQADTPWNEDAPPLDRDKNGDLVWGWKENSDLITLQEWNTLQDKGLVEASEGRHFIVDAETGDKVIPHSGNVSWNPYRERWILIAVQLGGSSMLGEVWFSEATSPTGPWSPARKIVTHDHYSFYNVKQHPYFARDNYIYFEGTYTQSFSGNDHATSRYDYNQIMYRLNLDDARLPTIIDGAPATDSY